jgi:hypothetical protein
VREREREAILHIRNHSLIILALTLGDDIEKTRIRNSDALEITMFT